MEKGYFHFNLSSHNFEPLESSQIEALVQTVPLPNQIPKKANRESASVETSRSDTVDALLSQNDDLMSRLAVHIRKNAFLEEKIDIAEGALREKENLLSSLKDQLLVYRQKEQLVVDRRHEHEADLDVLRERIQFLEFALNEKESFTNALRAESQQVWKERHRLFRYRSKIQTVYKLWRTKMRADLARLASSQDILESELQRERQTKMDLQTRIDEFVQHIQNQNRTHTSEVQKWKQDHLALEKQNQELAVRVADYSEQTEKMIELENQLLAQKRLLETRKNEFEQDSRILQSELGLVRTDCKNKVIEIEALQSQLQTSQTELIAIRSEFGRTVDQVETLQVLWAESQKRVEELEQSRASLQKLNQHLSVQLQERLRTDAHSRDALELQDLKEQLMPEAPDAHEVKNTTDTREVFDRIDGLLAELQSGISQDRR